MKATKLLKANHCPSRRSSRTVCIETISLIFWGATVGGDSALIGTSLPSKYRLYRPTTAVKRPEPPLRLLLFMPSGFHHVLSSGFDLWASCFLIRLIESEGRQ